MNRDALAEEIRLRYLYRRLILNGHLRLPREAATALLGPDCAYHLHSRAEEPSGLPDPATRGNRG